jgi:hypothetical protein
MFHCHDETAVENLKIDPRTLSWGVNQVYHILIELQQLTKLKTKLRGLSPQENYIYRPSDRRCRQSSADNN